MSQPSSKSPIDAAKLLALYETGEREFTEVDLRRAHLSQANLKGINLSYSDLSRADLSQADLRGADLSYAILDHTNLSRADLRGAILIGSDLRTARLQEADFSRADYSDSTRFPEGFDPQAWQMQKD